jgi:hypothetical protein
MSIADTTIFMRYLISSGRDTQSAISHKLKPENGIFISMVMMACGS